MATGESVGVDVLIAGGEGVGQVNFQLRYDKKAVRFAPPASPGEFLSQGGVPVDMQAVETPDGGLLVISLNRGGGGAGANGSGRLVRLNFVALQPGTAGFNFATAAVRTADNQPQPASFSVSNLEVRAR